MVHIKLSTPQLSCHPSGGYNNSKERKHMKFKVIIILVLVLAGLVTISYTKLSSRSFDKRYSVKLYAGDKVVGTWVARNFGTIEGTTLTFSVGNDMDINTQQVRICGTYSVEEIQ
jgi:hypothetical protein